MKRRIICTRFGHSLRSAISCQSKWFRKKKEKKKHRINCEFSSVATMSSSVSRRRMSSDREISVGDGTTLPIKRIGIR